MVSFIELFSSRLPVFTFFEEKFKEKYQIEQFAGHWNETYYVYIFVMSLVHISLLIYTFYLLYTCLRVKKTQGAGTTFVNGFCDVLFACFCMPCYIVYRGFLNPCKVLAEEKIVTKYVGLPTAPGYGVPAPAAPPAAPPPAAPPTPAAAPAAPPAPAGPVIMTQQPGATAPMMVTSTPPITESTRTRTKTTGGGQSKRVCKRLSKKVKI